MEFLTVGNSKIKIMLSKEEAESRGIRAEDSSYDDPEIRRAFRNILVEAKEKAGFDIGKEKVLIQIYPSRDGGMELFITKLGIISKEAANMISRSEHVAVISAKRVYYIFTTFEALVSAVRSVHTELLEDSTLFLLDEGGYCFSFCEKDQNPVLSRLSVLSEFGKKINELPALSLTEHARILRSGDAAEMLCKL